MGKGEVAFVLQTGPSTKAAEADNPVRKGASIQIGEIGNQSIILSETITDLSFVTPQTKGTPVYTQNVGTLYKDKLGVYANWAEFGEATFETEGKNTDEDTGSLKGWRYFHRYDNAPWPAENAAVGFYMRMPADAVSIPLEVSTLKPFRAVIWAARKSRLYRCRRQVQCQPTPYKPKSIYF